MDKFQTTIAAISTPPGTGGIGIVRLSGEEALTIGSKVYKGINNKSIFDINDHGVKFGRFINPENDVVIDEGLVLVMKAPNTYTREDVVEFQCHGSYASTQMILEALVKAGAKLAEPGEFTKRAFLNGRIDLSQAEAVIDIINAKTSMQLKTAINQLDGHISKKIRDLRTKLISIMAHLEAYIDFPEEDIDEVTRRGIIESANSIENELEYLMDTYETGKILREGLAVAIVGKTNVGKSSFLNEMLNENKAIVTDIAGTTRDVIEDYINIDGIPIKIIDTAGIRETEDFVEKLGIERSKKAIDEAQLVIFILDISQEISLEEQQIFDLIKNKSCIILLNKADKNDVIDESIIEEKMNINPESIIRTSMVDGTGIRETKKAISNLFTKKKISLNSENILTNIRHKEAVNKAKNHIAMFRNDCEIGMPEDILTINLKLSIDDLGIIIGEVVNDDILDEVFSKFCIGK